MARNKHPEETVQKILDISYRLFLEKGYDNTTIQDIVDALGMSKGAIYHHFKSKEEIVGSLGDRYYSDIDWFRDILEDKSLTGLQKLREIFLMELSDRKKIELDSVTINLFQNPRMLAQALDSTVNSVAPMIQALIEEGNQDGSIQVEQPKETAEAFLILLNLWLPSFSRDLMDFGQKIRFLKSMADRLGLPIIDESILAVCSRYYEEVIHTT